LISGVGSISVLSRDPHKLAKWYQDKLDFEIVGNEGHSVFVRAKGSDILIHLCGECDSWEKDTPGGRTGVWFHCGKVKLNRHEKTGQLLPASDPAEVEKTYHDLKSRGVEFSEELKDMSWGKYAIMKDLEGNEFEIS
jgi:uncharacterized glyoxalase superfamily protein PhnB